MRGKVRLQVRYRTISGITPAHAGKSFLVVICSSKEQDHPRMCGEKRQDRLDYYVPQGSPPRMRGKGHRMPINVNQVRITPAYAGKSSGDFSPGFHT